MPPTPLPTTDFPTRAPFFGPTKIPTEMPIEPPDPLPFPSIDPKGEIINICVCKHVQIAFSDLSVFFLNQFVTYT